MEHLKSPISKVSLAIKVRDEGTGLRVTGRIIGSHKNTISEWEERFAGQKETLMLYGLCHEFLRLTFEGDDVYTIVGKHTDPSQSHHEARQSVFDGSSLRQERRQTVQRCHERGVPVSSTDEGFCFLYQMANVVMGRPCLNCARRS
ncbi:hypothetical protein [Candidatus Magnetaquiglobus chichijimensis]|uniref:hypothetical protein n=1 Tax=Candidatus Magnetaquiglobus chichijimensis TaxID=3141448 RepID=UPI003B96CEA4